MGGVQEDGRPGAARPADPALLPAGQVRRRPGVGGAAPEHRAGRPGELRDLRPDRRHREVRPGPQDQVRDVRHGPDQGGDHRRAPLDRLGAAVGAGQGPVGGAGLRQARGPLLRTPSDGEVAAELGMSEYELQAMCTRSPSSAWSPSTRCSAAATTRTGRPSATPSPTRPGAPSTSSRARSPSRRWSGRQPARRAGEDGPRPLLLRGVHPRPDRRDARGDGEPGVPDPHQGGAPAPGQARRPPRGRRPQAGRRGQGRRRPGRSLQGAPVRRPAPPAGRQGPSGGRRRGAASMEGPTVRWVVRAVPSAPGRVHGRPVTAGCGAGDQPSQGGGTWPSSP